MDLLGVNSIYLQTINSVQSITEIVIDPFQTSTLLANLLQHNSNVNLTLYNQISYYIRPHSSLCPQTAEVQVQALRFFTNSVAIWEQQPEMRRPSLYQHITSNISSNNELSSRFILPFEECSNNLSSIRSVEFICELFGLLNYSVNSQYQFVEYLMKDTMFTQTLNKFT